MTGVAGVYGATISPTTSNSPTLQTTGVDIEVLNVAREAGIFIGPPTANFTAGFSFAPHVGLVTITAVLLTVEWSGLSNGHIGDKFGVQLNGKSQTNTAPFVSQTTQVTTLPSQDLHVGSNMIKVTVIPVDAMNTTNYLLYEVRLTVEYTFLA